jgi:hypothetical protein
LTLGDIGFLRNDIEWVQGLLEFQGIPTRTINDFLRSYAEVVTDELGDHGSPIADYLIQLVEEKG